jgi:hypothetical protein
MGYRLPEKRDDDWHKRHFLDVAAQSIIVVDNGTISRISIPCFYSNEVCHDKMAHDHCGWPYPGHPDKSCQLPPGCEKALVINEISLANEGYNSVKTAMVNPPEGLAMRGEIDRNYVNLFIAAMCPTAIETDIEVQFCVYITGRGSNGMYLSDVVTKGKLKIVAGALPDSLPDDPYDLHSEWIPPYDPPIE